MCLLYSIRCRHCYTIHILVGVKLENKEAIRNLFMCLFAVLFSRLCPGSYCRNSAGHHIPFIPHPLPSMLVASPLLLTQASFHFGFRHS